MNQAVARETISDLNDVTLEGVIPLDNREELGRGAYGIVFTVKYNGNVCAAKKIHPILTDTVSPEQKQGIKDDFIKECLCCSSIRHPNIVNFLGVYYESGPSNLPIMVMELMDTSLTKFVENNKSKISFGTKVSILHDVSLGLSFLHNRKRPILHRDLSSNNVMLTNPLLVLSNHSVAKIGDLGVAKVVRADNRQTKSKLTTTPGTLHFMPPEAQVDNPTYGTPIDVFSFGGIAIHVFSEEWPAPSAFKQKDPHTKKMITLTEAERRQQYLDKMTGKADGLRKMVEQCLDDDPDERPPIQDVSTIIEPLKETPSLAEALQSDHYHIKWTPCSDLPIPMYDVYVAMSNGTIYCTGSCPNKDNENEVYCYNTQSNQWKQLPRPGHRLGVIHMVDGKLTIFGGRDSTSNQIHDKVTTYNSKTNSWSSCYPNMLYNQHKPGVTTSHNHVIVMGGKSSQDMCHDSIEVLNYFVEKLQWKEVSAHLPDTMWALRPTISGNSIAIVGYNGEEDSYATYCHIPVEKIIPSTDQPLTPSEVSVGWNKLSPSPYYDTVTIPDCSPPVIIGGGDINCVPTSDITMYDICEDKWKKVGSLKSARDSIGVALLNKHTIIVIGGANGGKDIEGAKEHSLTTVEIGVPICSSSKQA